MNFEHDQTRELKSTLNTWSFAIWDQFQIDFREISDEFNTKCQQVFVKAETNLNCDTWEFLCKLHVNIWSVSVSDKFGKEIRGFSDEFQMNLGWILQVNSLVNPYEHYMQNTWSATISDQFYIDFRGVSDKFKTTFRQGLDKSLL